LNKQYYYYYYYNRVPVIRHKIILQVFLIYRTAII